MTFRGSANGGMSSPGSSRGDERTGVCKASCCKTPFGHATARDNLRPTDPRACKCHRKESS